MKAPLLAAVVVCSLALVSPAFAGNRPTPTPTPISTGGHIVTVSKTSITIKVGDEEKTFDITKKTKIKLDGVTTKATNLSAGEHATIMRTDTKSKEAKEIDARDVKTATSSDANVDASPSPSPSATP